MAGASAVKTFKRKNGSTGKIRVELDGKRKGKSPEPAAAPAGSAPAPTPAPAPAIAPEPSQAPAKAPAGGIAVSGWAVALGGLAVVLVVGGLVVHFTNGKAATT